MWWWSVEHTNLNLGYLIVVVRELEIHSSSMNVSTISQYITAHTQRAMVVTMATPEHSPGHH